MKAFMVLVFATLMAGGESLFDGKTLEGWTVREGEEWLWRVEDGKIIGGSKMKTVPHNTFITSAKRYQDFELTLQVKVEGKKPNAGIQFRSERVENHHEMIGYQADVGPGWWGRLYDESRRRKFLAPLASKEAAQASREGWNDYKIRCEGTRIRLWLNGILTCDYREDDPKIPARGLIALQAHSGPPFEVAYRAIKIISL